MVGFNLVAHKWTQEVVNEVITRPLTAACVTFHMKLKVVQIVTKCKMQFPVDLNGSLLIMPRKLSNLPQNQLNI